MPFFKKETNQIDPYYVPNLTKSEVIAIQSCWEGTANEGQQVLAMRTIVGKLALANEIPYQIGSFDQTAFVSGRMLVGKELFNLIKKNVGDISSE